VKQHGGYIVMMSQPQHGTVFTLYLLSQAVSVAATGGAVPDAVPRGQGETLLLVIMRTSKPFTSPLLLLDVSVSTSRVRHRRLSKAAVVLLVLLLTGLSGMKVAWSKTVFPAASWEQLSPEQVGMDDTVLRQFMDKIGGAGVVIREGYLIASWGGNTHGEWASATKPVYSTLMGFAIEEGKMHSPDDRLGSFVKREVGRKLLSDDYNRHYPE
jgi:hypothetical protein